MLEVRDQRGAQRQKLGPVEVASPSRAEEIGDRSSGKAKVGMWPKGQKTEDSPVKFASL